MAVRRKWLRFSLRTLLVSMTLMGVLFAWLLHHRERQVRERDRITAALAGSNSYAIFRYTLFGREVPTHEQWAWLLKISTPELKSIVLRPVATKPLPEAVSQVARRAPQLEYEGASLGKDADLPRSTSADTREIRLDSNELAGDCLAFVDECPQLLRVHSGYTMLTSKSLKALLNHPRLEQLEMRAEEDDLSLVEELSGPSALQQLVLRLTLDWRRSIGVLPPSRALEPGAPMPVPSDDDLFPFPRATGDFAWLKQCHQLRELTLNMPQDDCLMQAVGRHLHGVDRLDFDMGNPELLASLSSWTRLRHLCLENIALDDRGLSRITKLCSGLHTLEIEWPSGTLTPQGLRSLQALKGLKRLRLGTCKLTVEHMAVIAELAQLEELSIEDNGVDDEAVAPLAKLAKLSRISLERTKASNQLFPTIRGDWNDRRPWRGTMVIPGSQPS